MKVYPKVAFVKGVGVHRKKLASFELALRDARVEAYNIVSVSSIMPPHAEVVELEKANLPPYGSIVHAVLARNETDEAGRIISACIGMARPKDPEMYGYLSEVHEFGISISDVKDQAEDLAAEMLATTLGVPFNADDNWSEKKQVFIVDGRIIATESTGIVTEGVKDKWTTVVAAAIFLD